MATTTSIVEQCQVAPFSGAPAELLFPLTYSDIVHLSINPTEILVFYSVPCSQSELLDTIAPKLKHSLSLALKHFTPLAGHIFFPLTSANMPVSHYVNGDSVSLTIALSDADFNHHSRNHSRDDPNQLDDFVAHLPPLIYLPDFIKFSVVAIKLTLFPDQGICIGITQHHAIGDGSTTFHFINTWASIAKLNGDLHLLASSLPFYDRSGFADAKSLTTTCWNLMKKVKPVPVVSRNCSPFTDGIGGTFVLRGDHMEQLKNYIVNKIPSSRFSSFAIVCAHVWTSLARSTGEEVADDEPEYFSCAADCRGRLNPPLPVTYFGNCLTHVLAETTHGRLKGDQGIVVAAQVITEAIHKAININEKRVLDGAHKRLIEMLKLIPSRTLSISGSPRFDMNDADFGWGRPNKFDIVNLYPGVVCLSKSSEFKGGVHIQLFMPEVKMNAFAASFSQGLTQATKNYSRL